jgi:hypothetical protein
MVRGVCLRGRMAPFALLAGGEVTSEMRSRISRATRGAAVTATSLLCIVKGFFCIFLSP